MRHLFSSIFIFLFFFFIFTPITYADENFSTSFNATYSVLETGKANVDFAFTITNKTSKYYAPSYKIKLGFDNMEQIQAKDPSGVFNPKVTKQQDGFIIEFPFKKQNVGIGKTMEFHLMFVTNDVAEKNGELWEINIPGVSDPSAFADFTMQIKTPDNFGIPTYIKPKAGNGSLLFSKKQLGKSGISLVYGNKQYYKLQLTYNVKNTNVFPVNTEIALPPSTNYQDVLIENIFPKPKSIKPDEDGNWLAEYSLLPSQQIKVNVTANIAMHLEPKKEQITQDMIAEYTKQQPFWEKNDQIEALAKKLKTPEKIYNYVVNHLNYDLERVTEKKDRLGAQHVLKAPSSAVCLEFTDLFIALTRAAGIAAREIDGFAYTKNIRQRPLSIDNDILHAWPEYYDTKREAWIMVDPTWGNTTGGVDYFHTFDYDHITFVRKGKSSKYPIPAGGYKLSGSNKTKDIKVSFISAFSMPTPKLHVSLNIPKQIMAGLPLEGVLLLENKSNVAYPSGKFFVKSNAAVNNEKMFSFLPIPPLGKEEVPFSFETTRFLTNQDMTITIRVGEHTITQDVHVSAFIINKWTIGGIFFVILSAIIISIITRRAWRLSVFG